MVHPYEKMPSFDIFSDKKDRFTGYVFYLIVICSNHAFQTFLFR
jgi:hypothetical protein